MVIMAAIALFIVSLTSSIGASDIFNSSFYNTDAKARSAHQYLVIAAALGWSSLIILVIVMIIAGFTGGFTNVTVSPILLTAPNPTKEDLVAVYQVDKEILGGYTTQLMVLLVLILLSIMTIVITILDVVAAADITNMRQRDDKANAAHTTAIIASIAGVASVIFMVGAAITYAGIRSEYAEQLKEINMFEKRAETLLGPKPVTPITIVK
jgi:hypothetical protein